MVGLCTCNNSSFPYSQTVSSAEGMDMFHFLTYTPKCLSLFWELPTSKVTVLKTATFLNMQESSLQSVDHTYSEICDEKLKKQCMDEEHDGRGWFYRNSMCCVSKNWLFKTFTTSKADKKLMWAPRFYYMVKVCREKSRVHSLFLPCSSLPNSPLSI